MLKVNTKKISVGAFAKKYGFKPACLEHSYESDRNGKLKSWRVIIFDCGNIAFFDGYHVSDWTGGGGNLVDFFYDMITNGDVIKEEDK